MTNASSIPTRNRASRLDRSMASMRSSSREDEADGGPRRLPPGGRLPTMKRDEALKVYEVDDAQEAPQSEPSIDVDDDVVQRDDSGGSGSTIQQLAPKMDVVPAPAENRTSEQPGKIVYRRPRRNQQPKETNVQQQKPDQQQQLQQHAQNQQQQLPWGRNIEEGISGILKRLDQLAINNNGTCGFRWVHLLDV